ncbi:MAG TPA: hypothetical protein VF576_06230 [Rubricoccaceae bacterium]
MRRLALALLLLAPAATRAQTDAELVERVVAALDVAAQAETAFGSMQARIGTGAGLFSPQAVVDSVRAALLADPRPDLLREALRYLQSPDYARLLARTRATTQDPATLIGLTYGALVPKKGDLPDSLLAARYVAAAGTARQMATVMERAMRAVAETVPEARADLERRGQTADEAISQAVTDFEAQSAPLYVAAARVAFAGVPRREVEAAIAYYESPAGQHVTRAHLDGMLAAILPGVVHWAGETARAATQPAPPVAPPALPGKP